MTKTPSAQTSTRRAAPVKKSAVHNDWFVTKGISHVVDVMVPEAARQLTASPRAKPILIVAPSGSGKTYIKDLIIETAGLDSDRAERVNCSAFPETLIESELYGHKKGTFTGAISDREGLIKENAENVIVLDEIGTLPHYLQAKLLTFLDNGEFRRVGAETNSHSNQRVIGITNLINYPKSLRDDFRHRFFTIILPGLTERRHDIPFLLKRFAPSVKWTYLDMLRLMAYNWPGNLRELRRFAELAEENSQQINIGNAGALVWFEYRFWDYRLGRPVVMPYVPTLGRFDGFFDDRLWHLHPDLALKLDDAVRLFPMSKNIFQPIPQNKFTDKEAETRWQQDWATWCYIFSEDAFSPDDIWERRILFVKPIILTGDPESLYTLRDGGDRIDDLNEEVSKCSLGKSFHSTTTTDHTIDVRIVGDHYGIPFLKRPDLLEQVLDLYSPHEYAEHWWKRHKSLKPADIAKKFRMKIETVRSMIKRKRKKI